MKHNSAIIFDNLNDWSDLCNAHEVEMRKDAQRLKFATSPTAYDIRRTNLFECCCHRTEKHRNYPAHKLQCITISTNWHLLRWIYLFRVAVGIVCSFRIRTTKESQLSTYDDSIFSWQLISVPTEDRCFCVSESYRAKTSLWVLWQVMWNRSIYLTHILCFKCVRRVCKISFHIPHLSVFALH